MEGRSSNIVTKWFLGDLWEDMLGEGRGQHTSKGFEGSGWREKVKAEKDFLAFIPKPVLVSCPASVFCIQPSFDPIFLAFCPLSLVPIVYYPHMMASLLTRKL